ncbi:hypothetical protein [Xanthobacter autotrophicus]|nr:hypothetical protein [Xanthobacter autotrophicus]MDI4657862.1 hypothetical protein [Xanthobacter autotrophicus]
MVIKELKLLEKHLPKDGKYANVAYTLDCPATGWCWWRRRTIPPPNAA